SLRIRLLKNITYPVKLENYVSGEACKPAYSVELEAAYPQVEDTIDCINKAMAFLSVVASRAHGEIVYSAKETKEFYMVQGEVDTKYLDAYDSDCDDISSAKAVLMANLSSCDSDVLSKQVEDTIDCINKAMAFLSVVASRAHGEIVYSAKETKEFYMVQGEVDTKYLDAYDSDCDDISSAKAVLMANLSSCDSDVLSKYQKDHLCLACALGKSKKHSHKPKAKDSIQEKLYLPHMDLCGPMRIQSINRRKYILVIVDDYSRFTWVKFLRSKDEVSEFVIKFLKMIQVRLNVTVHNIRSDNGTKFINQTLRAYYEEVRISHQTSVARTPQQNGVFERRNRTLVEAACSMLIFSKASLFLWAEAVVTACYTQNRSLIRKHHNKIPYELLHDKKPDLSYLHVFGALCYPTNDGEDLVIDPEPAVSTVTPSSTIIDQDAPSTSASQTNQETPSLVLPLGVEEADHDIEVAHIDNNFYVDFLIPEPSSKKSSSQVVIQNNVHSVNQPPEHINKWTKDHRLIM
nr:retrovirus-related Pol polyprotein from transposon TNT 1-94 [Tanacetum cinerariifolium]